MYHKPRADIILSDQKLKALSRRLGTRQCCQLLPLLLNIVLHALTSADRKERYIRLFRLEKIFQIKYDYTRKY